MGNESYRGRKVFIKISCGCMRGNGTEKRGMDFCRLYVLLAASYHINNKLLLFEKRSGAERSSSQGENLK